MTPIDESARTPPEDPTKPALPQVRTTSRAALVAAAIVLALLFASSSLLTRGQGKAPASQQAQTPQADLTHRIDSLLEQAKRAGEVRERQSREAAALEEAYRNGAFQPPAAAPYPAPEQEEPSAYEASSRDRSEFADASSDRAPRSAPPAAKTALQEAMESPLFPPGLRGDAARPTGSSADASAPSSIRDFASLLQAAGVAQVPTPAPITAPGAVPPAATAPTRPSARSVSPLTLLAGSLIPATLTSAINSDLPGSATAIVRRDVYDSLTGFELLIPQGSRLFGRYDHQVAYGQSRLVVTWTRLTLPDGSTFDLEPMPGADGVGASGLADRVDRHLGRLFGGALLMSVVSAGAQLSQPSYSDANRAPSAGSVASGALGQQLTQVSSALIERELQVRPTVTLRPGATFSVSVTTDIVFPASYAVSR
jgi:type IV secretory pathway VirB10-like protein